MYYDFLVKIPENTGKVTVNRRGDTTYILNFLKFSH